jgi:glycosyltransferase involved in cell wall biosynthesis
MASRIHDVSDVIDYEVIFADDGSRDVNAHAVCKLEGPRITLVEFIRNFGQSSEKMAGIDNTFEYLKSHPYCADTIQFKIDNPQTNASYVTFKALPNLKICSASTSFPVAETATMVPGFGSCHFADPTENVFVLDSLKGLIDPAQFLHQYG